MEGGGSQSRGRWLRLLGVGGVLVLSLLSGCQFLPPELRKPKLPFRMSPLRHEVTLQAAPGMGPAPFKVDQAEAGPNEVKLTLSNPAAFPIRVIWREGTFISADSIPYAIGVRGGPDQTGGSPPNPTTIDSNQQARLTVIAVTKDGKPVAPGAKSMEPPFRVGLKVTVETPQKAWKGTLWIFVS